MHFSCAPNHQRRVLHLASALARISATFQPGNHDLHGSLCQELLSHQLATTVSLQFDRES
jgi:hypothetical protein